MKKVLMVVLTCIIVAAMLVACTAPQAEGPADENPANNEQGSDEQGSNEQADSGEGLTIGLVTKIGGHPLFETVTNGAKEAAKINGDTIDSQGPSDGAVEKQIEIINNFIAQKVDCILVSASDPDALAPALKKAMEEGITVVSYDSDVNADARSVFVNTTDTKDIAIQMVDAAYEATGGEGEIAILSAAATATNQNAWIANMEEYLKEEKNAGLEMVSLVYGDDQMDKSYQETNGLIKSYPNLKCIISPTGVGVIAAAKAVQDAGLEGKVYVTGLGLPSEVADYIKAGIINKAFLYNPFDLGYVATLVAREIKIGNAAGSEGDVIAVGEMGEREIILGLSGETQVVLDKAPEFNPDNIDEWAEKF